MNPKIAWLSTFIIIIIMIFMLINSEKSPNMLIFSLVLMSLTLCIMIYDTTKKSWMSMILFLSMVGGMMILFSLVASIYPKSLTSSNKSKILPISSSILLMFINHSNFSSNSNVIKSFFYKMEFIMIVILILNIMLIFLSKMINSPLKPFRSI